MKTRWWVVLVVAAVAATALAANYARTSYVERKRETNYQSILESYRDGLKSGARRKDVESYLRMDGATFQRVCYDAGRACEDRALVGTEDPPWYCGRNDVFLSFQFEAPPYSQADEDILRRIDVLHKLEDCL